MVVPEKDENALYQAIHALLTNQELRADISERGYETALKKFSHERMVGEYERIFLS